MVRKPPLCAGCGQSLSVSVLFVHDATGGPTRSFHNGAGQTCYLDALARHEALEATQDCLGRAPAGDQAAEPISDPGTAPGPPGPVFGVSGGTL